MWFISVPLLVLMLLVVGVTILVVKGGSIALRLTGLEESRANFQAISAVTGTGFTTRESELVVADPRRRRIVSFLMIFGNVVIVMLISLLVGSFAAVARTVEKWYLEYGIVVLVLAVGGLLLYLALRSRGLTRRWNRWVNEKLTSRLKLRERPVAEVLSLAEGYGVAEIRVEAASPCAGKTLAEADLRPPASWCWRYGAARKSCRARRPANASARATAWSVTARWRGCTISRALNPRKPFRKPKARAARNRRDASARDVTVGRGDGILPLSRKPLAA